VKGASATIGERGTFRLYKEIWAVGCFRDG
jgi:hypothetical protein